MENRSDKDHKLSQGTYGPEKHQEGSGKPDLCEVDQETEVGQDKLAVGLEEPSELSMTVGEGDTGLVFPGQQCQRLVVEVYMGFYLILLLF